MAKQSNTVKSAANDFQSLFDPQNYHNVFKTVAEMNQRFTKVMIDAGERTTEITTKSAKEAFSNLRDMSQMREEPSDYAKAYGDFLQRQMDLMSRTSQSLVNVGQKASTATTELATEAGNKVAEKASANAERATDTATAAAKKAA